MSTRDTNWDGVGLGGRCQKGTYRTGAILRLSNPRILPAMVVFFEAAADISFTLCMLLPHTLPYFK